jgi:S-adenosylmethionine hydrolase
MPRIITLLTDFGTADGYVGEMKGVILSAIPDVMIVDISHALSPQDIDAARLTLARVWRRFPRGTIHVVVVDPGVGTERTAMAVESDGRLLVGPDNGVLSPALLNPGARTVALAIPPDASPTFHGRDVFAPAAAALVMTVLPARMLPSAEGLCLSTLNLEGHHPRDRRRSFLGPFPHNRLHRWWPTSCGGDGWTGSR